MKYSKKYQSKKLKYQKKTSKNKMKAGSQTTRTILDVIPYEKWITYSSYRFIEYKEKIDDSSRHSTRNSRKEPAKIQYLDDINHEDDLYGEIRNEMLDNYNIINNKRQQLLDNYFNGSSYFYPYYIFHILGSNSQIEQLEEYPNIGGGGGICIMIHGSKYLLTCAHCFENTIYLKTSEDIVSTGYSDSLNNERLVLFNNGIVCSCKCVFSNIDIDLALCEITDIFPLQPYNFTPIKLEYNINDIPFYDLLANTVSIDIDEPVKILGHYGQEIIEKKGNVTFINDINQIEYKLKPCKDCFEKVEQLNLIDKGAVMCRNINNCTKKNYDYTQRLLKKHTDNYQQEELEGGYDIVYIIEPQTQGGDSGYPIYNKYNKMIGIHNGDNQEHIPTLSTGTSIKTIKNFIEFFITTYNL